ncbi:MAG: MerR family transcriptional regulator [Chloroflexi bacterium]|nr:MerR family transcriptional regulator [Chloroflexota bacterium]MDA1241320.1 MerR family transcriptional regulator [Chloroflexota bacterium]MQC19478.1 MerR family transcriptional regulator [Chloroflexota bacterium]
MTFQHDEPLFQISVVSRIVGLHQQTIRTYERIGLVRPARTQGNTRLFSREDVERLQQVVRLVNDLGVNLAGVEVILQMRRQIEGMQQELAETRAALGAAHVELERLGRRPRPEDNSAAQGRGGDGR